MALGPKASPCSTDCELRPAEPPRARLKGDYGRVKRSRDLPRQIRLGASAPHSRTQRSRKALLITLTEESAMAAAAISGDSMSLSAG